MTSKISTVNSTMTSDYGTNPGHKEQLSGYFDVDNESVSINKGYRIFGPCTKKKKIGVAVGVVAVILIILIIIIAVVVTNKHKQQQGEISSLKSGKGCSGDVSKQSMCRSGDCIQNIFVCDGMNDCSEGEDEIQALCDKFHKKGLCKEGQFQCLVTRTCISDHLRCNGKYDCGGNNGGDYSDERGCFSIDKITEVVSVTKKGDVYPVAASVDSRVAELICLDMGFKSLLFITSGEAVGEDERRECVTVKAGFDPTVEVKGEETELINNMIITASCDEDALTMTCEHDFCGAFGNYTGPSVPESWTSPDMIDELAKSTTKFPWVVEIYKGAHPQCKGTIVDAEWVLTSLNCIDEDVFYSHKSKKTWKIVAGATTDNPQTRMIFKVMRNHFEDMLDRNDADLIVAVQVDPPFELNNMVHQVCLGQPALLPHFNCFAAATTTEGSTDIKHVRVVPLNSTSKCGTSDLKDGTFCLYYPHTGDANSCLKANGSPISCLDPAKNSWTLAGIATADIGCHKDQRTAASFDDEFNFYWAQIITAPARTYDATECGNKAEFQEIRFMSGSRQGEVYMDIMGWGGLAKWHTLYNFSSAIDLLKDEIAEAETYPTVRIANRTGITSKRIAVLNCPADATTFCACKVEYKVYSPIYDEAPSLHFIDDSNENGILDGKDFEYENWDEQNNLDDLFEQYEDFGPQQPVDVEEIFPKVCPEHGKSEERQCLDGNGCVHTDYICDGYANCTDGSDEIRENCERILGLRCPEKWFKCRTTYDCIAADNRCDGVPDCADASDERECISVLDNSVVIVEKNGLPLPLGGLPPEVSNATEAYLATAMCKYMGFGEYVSLLPINNGSADFSQGCYKLATQKFGDSYIVSTDFNQFSADECDTTLTLVCSPPGCGITSKNTGPKAPKSWPTLESPSEENSDYPWVVHIKKGGVVECGATVVLSKWIVTTYDCIEGLTDDLTVAFQDRSTEDPTIYKITHRVNFFSTKTDRLTGDPLERNVAMFGIYPEFELSETTYPLCLLPPLYVENSICYLSGHDNNNDLQFVRVVPRSPEVCQEAGIPLSEATADEQCVAFLDKSDTCIDAHGSSLQCLDKLRNQWKFTAIMTTDIGQGCEGNNTTIGVATNTRYLLPWMFDVVDDVEDVMDMTCNGGGEMAGEVQSIVYHKSNYDDEWYMITAEGLAVEWADDEETLRILAEPLVDIFGAFKVTGGRKSDNITAISTVKLSSCNETTLNCDCTKTDAQKGIKVSKFFIVSVNENDEDQRDREFQEEEDVIADYDYTTPSEFYSYD